MIQEVEELATKLKADFFTKLPALGNREIQVGIARAPEKVPRMCPKGSVGGRRYDRASRDESIP